MLYLLPSATSTYWAWDIANPRSSVLISAVYMTAIAYIFLVLRENDWLQVRNRLGAFIVFSLVLLGATAVHWEDFKPYHPTTLAWLAFYYSAPLLIILVSRLQIAAYREPSDHGPTDYARMACLADRARDLLFAISAAHLCIRRLDKHDLAMGNRAAGPARVYRTRRYHWLGGLRRTARGAAVARPPLGAHLRRSPWFAPAGWGLDWYDALPLVFGGRNRPAAHVFGMGYDTAASVRRSEASLMVDETTTFS